MKKILFLCVLSLSFFSPKAQLNKEQQTIKQTFFNFLNFYKANERTFNGFEFYKGMGKENTTPYHIQWTVAEKYFKYLRSKVPFVGEAYIQAEKNHFKYADSCFKANPEDEIAAGFDYDRWSNSQETIGYTIKWHTSAKNKYLVSITGNTALLKIGSPLDKGAPETDRSWNYVPFAKEKGKWVMAGNMFSN